MNEIDFYSDDSLYKFVWPDNSYNDMLYRPEWLMEIQWEHIVDVVNKILNLDNQLIKSEVLGPLNELWNEFYQKFWINMYIQSAFRDFLKQSDIYINMNPNMVHYISFPWHSEHQTWYALDVINAQIDRNCYNPHFKWLKDNAYKYWFHLSYQKWISVDWYNKEDWHIRYLWKELSTYLFKNNLSYTEFFEKEKKISFTN